MLNYLSNLVSLLKSDMVLFHYYHQMRDLVNTLCHHGHGFTPLCLTATTKPRWFKVGKHTIVSQSDSLWSSARQLNMVCVTPNGKSKKGFFSPFLPRSCGCSRLIKPLPEPVPGLGGWHTLGWHSLRSFCIVSSPFSQL